MTEKLNAGFYRFLRSRAAYYSILNLGLSAFSKKSKTIQTFYSKKYILYD